MPEEWSCPDDPPALWKRDVCLNALSKDWRGELNLEEREEHACNKPECKTFKTIHRLKVGVQPHPPCDSSLAKYFDGTLVVERLYTVFDQNGNQRGFHAGDFEWFGQGVRVAGRISGMTNVGTHREPVFEPCERCHHPGIMEGRLCGSVVETDVSELRENQVIGIYRILFDPSEGGGSGSVRATFEGVIVSPCHG